MICLSASRPIFNSWFHEKPYARRLPVTGLRSVTHATNTAASKANEPQKTPLRPLMHNRTAESGPVKWVKTSRLAGQGYRRRRAFAFVAHQPFDLSLH